MRLRRIADPLPKLYGQRSSNVPVISFEGVASVRTLFCLLGNEVDYIYQCQLRRIAIQRKLILMAQVLLRGCPVSGCSLYMVRQENGAQFVALALKRIFVSDCEVGWRIRVRDMKSRGEFVNVTERHPISLAGIRPQECSEEWKTS